MKLSELETGKNVKFVIYGDSGAGKTSLAVQFPGPLWVADFDGKIGSGANYLKATNPAQLKQVEFDNYQPSADQGGTRVFQKFMMDLEAFETQVKQGTFGYKTIVIDSLTTFSDMMMLEVMAANPGIKQLAKGVPAMQHYLVLVSQFKEFVARIKALPCYVVLIAHIKREKNEMTGEFTHRPMLSGQLPELLPILFDEVYRAYTDIKDKKRVYLLQTVPHGGYTARTQMKSLPPLMNSGWNELAKHLGLETHEPMKEIVV